MQLMCCLNLHIASKLPIVAYVDTRRVNGSAVRALREALGIAHGDLASRVGISAPFLTRIEKGERGTSAPVARRLAESMGVPFEAITYPVSPGYGRKEKSAP